MNNYEGALDWLSSANQRIGTLRGAVMKVGSLMPAGDLANIVRDLNDAQNQVDQFQQSLRIIDDYVRLHPSIDLAAQGILDPSPVELLNALFSRIATYDTPAPSVSYYYITEYISLSKMLDSFVAAVNAQSPAIDGKLGHASRVLTPYADLYDAMRWGAEGLDREPWNPAAAPKGGKANGGGGNQPPAVDPDGGVITTSNGAPQRNVPPHGNVGKQIGDVIVRPNQQSGGAGDGIDWWLGMGGGGEGAIASEVQKWIQRGPTGPGSGPGGGPNPPGGHGLGHGPTGTGGGPGASSNPQQNPGYNTAHNADPYGGQGQETDRSQTSRDSSDRQGGDATQRDQDGTPTTEDYVPDQDGTPTAEDSPVGNVADTGGGGNGVPYGSVQQDGSVEFSDPSGNYDPGSGSSSGGGSMPDPDSSDGGGSEGPSFTPGFHFTPHGGNTGRPIEQPSDPVDASWAGFQQSSNPIAAMLGLGGGDGSGNDWGGNNPHYDPAELADPETSGRYRNNQGYKPDPDATGPSNPHSYSGKTSQASRYIIATRAARLAASARSIRFK